MREGKFEIYKDVNNEFRFRYIAGNGEIVCSSEGYSSKQGCIHGINVIKNISENVIFEEIL